MHRSTNSSPAREHAPAEKGFTLVETLVAVGILMIAISAPLTLIRQSLTSADAAKNNITAENLARDALEYVKNVRDTNLRNNLGAWTTGLEKCLDKTCTVDTVVNVSNPADALVTVSPGASPVLKYDATTDRYSYTTGSNSTFRRELSITTVEADKEYRAEVTVSWTRRGIPYTYRTGQNFHKLIAAKGCPVPAVNGLHVGVDSSDPNYGFLDCGMLVHYTFDTADVQGTLVRDTSGFANDGTFYGGSPSIVSGGKRGQAIDFDGSDDKVYGPKVDLFGDFTLTAWVKSPLSGGVQGLVGSWDGYKFKGVTNGIEFMVKTPSVYDQQAPVDFSDNGWHFVALRLDTSAGTQSDITAFVDGTQVLTGSVSGNRPMPTERNFLVGCWPTTGGRCFTEAGVPEDGGHLDGLIDDVRLYGRTLDDWEIRALYENNW